MKINCWKKLNQSEEADKKKKLKINWSSNLELQHFFILIWTAEKKKREKMKRRKKLLQSTSEEYSEVFQ